MGKDVTGWQARNRFNSRNYPLVIDNVIIETKTGTTQPSAKGTKQVNPDGHMCYYRPLPKHATHSDWRAECSRKDLMQRIMGRMDSKNLFQMSSRLTCREVSQATRPVKVVHGCSHNRNGIPSSQPARKVDESTTRWKGEFGSANSPLFSLRQQKRDRKPIKVYVATVKPSSFHCIFRKNLLILCGGVGNRTYRSDLGRLQTG